MFDFFKKKEEIKVPGSEPTPTVAPVSIPIDKEQVTKDPRTGELIYQRIIPAEDRESLLKSMQKNAGLANEFIVVSRQRLGVEAKLVETNNKINESEKEIAAIVNKVRDTLKLDKRWNPNFQIGMMERRDPPAG